MPQFNLDANAAFVRFQKRFQRLPRRVFQQSDEIRRAQYRRHPVRGEINDMLLLHDELQFAGGADARERFHLMNCHSRRRI